eukprot:UC4_evm8s1590
MSSPISSPSEEKPLRRVLVTGGAGFLGSHLCRRLVNEGHDVICMDNYFTGTKNNVEDLIGLPNFELVRHDVTEHFTAEVDYIFNLACPASPVHYQFNPIKTMKTSFLGAMNMLGLAKRLRECRILQTSTSEVYGDPDISPQSEDYWGNVNPIGVRSCYDEGKRAAETLFFDRYVQIDPCVHVSNHLISLRYGPGMHPHDGRVVSNFIMQALKNEDITIYGDGSQTRSFCYVDDQIEGLCRLMEQNETVGPINIGNPNEELAEIVIEVTNSKSKLTFLDLPKDDPKQRKPDITLAKKYLGWEPKTELREGIVKTAEYFKSLDMRKFPKPTKHNAFLNSKEISK